MLLAALLANCAPGVPAVEQPTCVVDGDTFRLNRERIRIENIDAPELRGQCPAERRLATRARDRLRDLLNSGEVGIERRGRDRYGRSLARVTAGGADVGAVLIREGLARRWEGRRRSWCDGG